MEQGERYARNILLDGIGAHGQARLSAARVLVVGAGGLGSPALYYLAAAGVGVLGICDGDVVEESNLQRQIAHFTADIGAPKAKSAAQKLRALNPHLEILTFAEHLTLQNAPQILSGFDLVIEATDSFSGKFSVNEACMRAHKTLVRANALGFTGGVMSVRPGVDACFECVFPTPPKIAPNGGTVGILGACAGLFGTLLATEAFKILTGVGEPLFGQLLTCDVRFLKWRKIALQRRENCRVCGGL